VLDRVAPHRDHEHAHPRLLVLREPFDYTVVEHRLVEGHRKLFLCLKADGGLELLFVLDRRQLHHPEHDALARDAKSHPV
jgi:hypothetical protein